MVKGFVLTILAALALLGVYLFFYLGFFKEVKIARESRPELFLVMKPHLGAYHQLSDTFAVVEKWAFDNKIDCSTTFGEYLDDPSSVDQDRLRSNVGCLLKAKPDIQIVPPLIFETRPARNYAVARFQGSPSIGPMKVYPKVSEYLNRERLKPSGAVIEVYVREGSGMTTEFLFPLAN